MIADIIQLSVPEKPVFNVIREFPKASREFLRVQIGRIITRSAVYPVTDSNGKLIRYYSSGRSVQVFQLMGFGPTLKDAERMASTFHEHSEDETEVVNER